MEIPASAGMTAFVTFWPLTSIIFPFSLLRGSTLFIRIFFPHSYFLPAAEETPFSRCLCLPISHQFSLQDWKIFVAFGAPMNERAIFTCSLFGELNIFRNYSGNKFATKTQRHEVSQSKTILLLRLFYFILNRRWETKSSFIYLLNNFFFVLLWALETWWLNSYHISIIIASSREGCQKIAPTFMSGNL